MTTYLLYRSEQEDSYTFFDKGNESIIALLEHDAELIWSVEASSWEEAIKKKNEYLSW